MKNLTIATAAAAGFAAAVLGLAGPAAAAPSGADNAQETIGQLEAGGNRVIVNKLGSTPLSQATVVSVQPGSDIREWVWDGDHDDSYLTVTGKVYYVDVR